MRAGDHLDRVKRAIVKAGADGDSRREAGLLENLGDLFLGSDTYDQALAQYEKIIRSGYWHHYDPSEKARVWYKAANSQLGLGENEKALRLASKAERLLGTGEDPVLLGKIYSLSGQINRRIGNQRDALAYSLRALDVLRRTDANGEIAFVQLTCGSIFFRQGSFIEAVRYFQDALATYRRIDDEEGIAKAYNNLGVAYKNLCQWESATQSLKKAMDIDRRFGNYAGVALRMLNLGLIQYQRGDWDGSQRLTEKSLQMSRGVKNSLGVALCSLALARIARHRRRWDDSRRFAREGLRISRSHGNRREIAASYEEMGAWYFARGQHRTARAFFEKSISVAETISEKSDHIAEVNRRLSEVAVAEGCVEEGIDRAKRSLRVAVAIKDLRLVGLGLRTLSAAHRLAGNSKLAAHYIGRSVGIFDSFGIPFDLARSLLESAMVARRNDDLGTARSDLTRAEAIFRRLLADGCSTRALIEFARMKIRLDRLEDGLVLLQKAERTVDREFPSGDIGEIRKLRRVIEKRFVESSLSSSNRFLSFQESMRSRSGLLGRVIEELGAERGFLFRLVPGGEYEIIDPCGVEAGAARQILGDAFPGSDGGEEVRPRVSLGAVDEEGARSFLVAPVDGMGGGGIYIDRAAGPGRTHFNRRDLNYLVGVARALHVSGISDVPAGEDRGFHGVVTKSPRMLEILDTFRKLGGVNVTILLQGETGTGKGLVAYEIAKEDSAPFVTINCADLTETILESELFGHARNAFTGAGAAKKGLFEVADGGTVFIDEIDKTSRNFQKKLLRVVDRREFKPVGSVDVRHVDCRIICASNKDLSEEVRQKNFLKDLYFRLNVVSIVIPPLRERSEDIPALTEHFLARFSRSMGKRDVRFDDDAIALLSAYPWPGNVRDLQNEVERAVALATNGETVRVDSLSDDLVAFSRFGIPTHVSGEKPLARMVAELEGRVIAEALRESDGNKSQAARRLGLTRKGLRNKILRYGLE